MYRWRHEIMTWTTTWYMRYSVSLAFTRTTRHQWRKISSSTPEMESSQRGNDSPTNKGIFLAACHWHHDLDLKTFVLLFTQGDVARKQIYTRECCIKCCTRTNLRANVVQIVAREQTNMYANVLNIVREQIYRSKDEGLERLVSFFYTALFSVFDCSHKHFA